jgi:hypothetical protein
MTLLLALACAPELREEADEPVRLEAWVEEKKVAAGEPIVLHVRLQTQAGWTAEPELGLPSELGAELVASAPGDWTFELSGDPGSYLIPPTVVTVAGPQGQQEQLQTTPIYVDLGVQGPSSELQPMEALLEAPEEERNTALILALVGGALLLLAGLAALVLAPLLRRGVPQRQPAPRHAEIALAEWAAVLDQELDPAECAMKLSRILRRYIQDSTGAPALSATTVELLADLALVPRWRPQLEALRRVLQSTDRIKYAGAAASEGLFDQLDQDFRALVVGTRPWRRSR